MVKISSKQAYALREIIIGIPKISSMVEANDLSSNTSEKAIRTCLESLNYTYLEEKLFRKKSLTGFVHDERLIGRNIYIDQPFGTQNSPDFIIGIDGLIVCLENKSSKRGNVMWNSHIPRNDFLYHFHSPRVNLICFNPINTNNQIMELIEWYKQNSKKQANEMNEEFLRVQEENKIELSVYPRFMIQGTNLHNPENYQIIQDHHRKLLGWLEENI